MYRNRDKEKHTDREKCQKDKLTARGQRKGKESKGVRDGQTDIQKSFKKLKNVKEETVSEKYRDFCI